MKLVNNIKLNRAQELLVIHLNRVLVAMSFWSRGTGKSFIIAWLIKMVVETMPRSSWTIVGETYRQILTRTLPSTKRALEYFGYHENVDYYIKKRPPANSGFSKPFEAPGTYEHYMIFRNGCGFHLVSLDPNGGSSRGLNIDGVIGDEALLLNRERLGDNVLATNRGNDQFFKHLPYHHGLFLFSSMAYGSQGKWLFDYAKYYEKKGIDYKSIKKRLVKNQLKFIDTKIVEERKLLWKEIIELKAQIKWFASKSKGGIFYNEFDIFDNIQNVGIKYIQSQRRDLTEFKFLVEILNYYPEQTDEGFYPALSREKHTYKNTNNNTFMQGHDWDSSVVQSSDSRWDSDVAPLKPLTIAADWGAKINCLTVSQYDDIKNILRFLKSLYVKHPKNLDDLAQDFCDYYRHHPEKHVRFLYDHTGNSRVANSKETYAEQFAKILEKNGWTVEMATKGAAMSHQNKYLLWNKILKKEEPNMPDIQFNLDNCKDALVSMENAPVKEGKTGIEKNKSSEKNELIPQEEATHFSDTCDMHVVDLFSDKLVNMPSFIDVIY
ncbi:hypothetical protein [Marivirga sp.]|uniref:hypothetical protein n=1 Tax=Marivirga sp. TaxID=2018662 RepID=UPI003DA74F84